MGNTVFTLKYKYGKNATYEANTTHCMNRSSLHIKSEEPCRSTAVGECEEVVLWRDKPRCRLTLKEYRISGEKIERMERGRAQLFLTRSRKIKLFEPSEGIFIYNTKYWTTKKICKIGPLGPKEK